jgi:hypothetical protein
MTSPMRIENALNASDIKPQGVGGSSRAASAASDEVMKPEYGPLPYFGRHHLITSSLHHFITIWSPKPPIHTRNHIIGIEGADGGSAVCAARVALGRFEVDF